MLFNILNFLTHNLVFFRGSYSNNIFPEPLSKEEEEKYISLCLQGDKEARNELILHNLRLIAHIVKKFETTNYDVDDLIGIGTIGLIKAVDSYSLNKNVKLTTYAAKCIENEILMYFRADKKNSKNISIYEGISYDKEGNEITILDVLQTPDPDFLEEIYKNVWDEESYATENIIAVHIRHLREKIEINPKKPQYLKVIWGIGYKMDNIKRVEV